MWQGTSQSQKSRAPNKNDISSRRYSDTAESYQGLRLACICISASMIQHQVIEYIYMGGAHLTPPAYKIVVFPDL